MPRKQIFSMGKLSSNMDFNGKTGIQRALERFSCKDNGSDCYIKCNFTKKLCECLRKGFMGKLTSNMDYNGKTRTQRALERISCKNNGSD